MTFEENIKRLEEILKTIEQGKASLEEMNTLFAEAVEISKKSYDMLDKSKGKITVLRAELEKLTEQPFE